MSTYFLEQEILGLVEKSRKNCELNLLESSFLNPQDSLKKTIGENFEYLNLSIKKDKSSFVYLDEIQIDIETESEHNYSKSVLGSSLILLGKPILKKRFVMKGSATGTSIASKYLSRAFPQSMPARILGTKIFGRALGRAVPYMGWSLLIIDAVELLIMETKTEKNDTKGFRNGFGGGSFGGGGAESSW